MTENEKVLVQSSFAKVAPIANQAASIFYAKLFELDPTLKPLFTTDLTVQGEKLMTMLAAAVNGLDDLPSLVPIVQELGRRHVDYGVEAKHYETVGTALIYTLGVGLGEDFTDDVKNAWISVYQVLSETMINAAQAA